MCDTPALLRCEAIGRESEDFPGRLRVRLVDAADRPWFFVDKEPIFSREPLGDLDLPVPVHIRCRIRSTDLDGVVVVSTASPDSVAAEGGETTFRVRPDQVEQDTA